MTFAKSLVSASALCTATIMASGLLNEVRAFNISGNIELEAYGKADTEGNDVIHEMETDVDLTISKQFNDKWSAQIQLESSGPNAKVWDIYDAAFVEYRHSSNFSVKLGDLTFSEGRFKYYGYDDEEKFAAGMRSHDVRGIEIDAFGLQVGAGFARGANDENGSDGDGRETYDIHLAYQLDFAKQSLRAFGDYKSLQDKHLNEVHGGVESNLLFGNFTLHAVYGLHVDQLTEDEPKAAHAILLEPEIVFSKFNFKGSALYTIVDSKKQPTVHGWNQDYYTLMNQKYEVPEFLYVYIEPSIALNKAITLGIPVEYHTNTPVNYKDVSYETLESGIRAYLNPVENMAITAMAKAIIPIGDEDKEFNNSQEETKIIFGAELSYGF